MGPPLRVLCTPHLYPTTPMGARPIQSLGNSDTARLVLAFPAHLPDPSLVARAVLGMFKPSQEGTHGHGPAGGSHWKGTLG